MKTHADSNPGSGYQPKSNVSIYLFTGAHLPLWIIKLSLRNRLAEAMEKLIFQGIAKREAYAILRKGLDLLEEEPFWKALKGGAAIFMSKNHFSVKILPYWVEPEVYVDSEFVTGPISGSFR